MTPRRLAVWFRRAVLRAQCRTEGHMTYLDTQRVIRCARCPDWWTV